ncbi:MAG: hypothetical protein RJB39_653 [Candidatus Parcubacteria bacterium]|jgi:peptidoglycan hydrolase-like protein with peptidoglycan-binding domain
MKKTPIFLLALGLFLSPFSTHATMPIDPTYCMQFNNNLKYGMSSNSYPGSEVTQLQSFLGKNGFFNQAATGYFGNVTLAAVKRFQAKYGIPATGFVGMLTRAKINALMNCNGQALIMGVSGPSTLAVNESGTWSVTARDLEQGDLSYVVSWGDEPRTYPTTGTTATPQATAAVPTQFSTFTHTYATAGTYTITFTVYPTTTGVSSSKTLYVTVTDPNQARIKVLTPNGGERWDSMSNQVISWSIDDAHKNSKVDLYLVQSLTGPAPCVSVQPCPMTSMVMPMPWVLDKNIAANAAYSWITGTDVDNRTISRGQYRVQVCAAGSTDNCDYSDAAFTIVDPTYESNRAPVISSISGPMTARKGQVSTWTVNAYDPEGRPLQFSAAWSNNANSNGISGAFPVDSSSNVFHTSFGVDGTYTFRFLVVDDVGKYAESSLTVRVQD